VARDALFDLEEQADEYDYQLAVRCVDKQ